MNEFWQGYIAGIATIVLPSLLYLLAAYLWPDPDYDALIGESDERERK